MRTSKQWWNEVKNDPDKFNEWLVKQYRGEVTAASRIRQLSTTFGKDRPNAQKLLEIIAKQEEQHAQWVLALLRQRGIEPSVENAENRYWTETLPGITDLDTGTAVAAHAEKMRLERITAIAEDPDAPSDVRKVFHRILRDEIFHEETFRMLSTPEAMEKTRHNHEQGAHVLGLSA